MLYDSTKNLLQSILSSLEADDETRWDDRTESGKCMSLLNAPDVQAAV